MTHAHDNDDSRPRVLILTTGGTIASRTDAPLLDGHDLVGAVPQLLDYAKIQVEQFSVIASANMTPVHWLSLAKRVNAIFSEDDQACGIVITHGTDTIAETAYFLNLTVRSNRPVVLVGAMRSSDEISADGPSNLINAVRVASSGEAVGQGVLVVLNEEIRSARDVFKTDNRRVQTFAGSGAGQVGTVDPDGVCFHYRSMHPHTSSSEFDISAVEDLPVVPVLGDFTGISRSLVEGFMKQPMDGLIIRTFAGGRMSPGMLDGLRSVTDRRIPIVVSPCVPYGRIVSPPDYGFPAVISNGQRDNTARILLMLALTRTSDRTEIQQYFDRY